MQQIFIPNTFPPEGKSLGFSPSDSKRTSENSSKNLSDNFQYQWKTLS